LYIVLKFWRVILVYLIDVFFNSVFIFKMFVNKA